MTGAELAERDGKMSPITDANRWVEFYLPGTRRCLDRLESLSEAPELNDQAKKELLAFGRKLKDAGHAISRNLA